MTGRSAGNNSGSLAFEINSGTGRPGFPENLKVFSRIKNCYAELERELVIGCTSGGYDQLETSPETIEQELQFENADRQT